MKEASVKLEGSVLLRPSRVQKAGSNTYAGSFVQPWSRASPPDKTARPIRTTGRNVMARSLVVTPAEMHKPIAVAASASSERTTK